MLTWPRRPARRGFSFLDHRQASLHYASCGVGQRHRMAACLRGLVELWKNSMPPAREDVLALELIVDIADGRAVRGRDLARRLGLKPRSLEQLLQRLARNGILVGQRGGQGGGYRLARDAALISASDVVRAARTEPPRLKFIRRSSAVRRLVKELEQRTFDSLREVTIASLASNR